MHAACMHGQNVWFVAGHDLIWGSIVFAIIRGCLCLLLFFFLSRLLGLIWSPFYIAPSV